MLHLNHIRKRHGTKETSSSNNHRSLDNLFYIIAIIAPFMTIPQLYLVWVKKSVEGVSIASWVGYSIFNCFWVVYGVIHKDKPIIVCNLAWVIVQGLVVFGVLFYK